jgi:hypothetical protein
MEPQGQNVKKFRVVLYRTRGGRYVKEWPAKSKYAAKKILDEKEAKYDSGYYLEIKKM